MGTALQTPQNPKPRLGSARVPWLMVPDVACLPPGSSAHVSSPALGTRGPGRGGQPSPGPAGARGPPRGTHAPPARAQARPEGTRLHRG